MFNLWTSWSLGIWWTYYLMNFFKFIQLKYLVNIIFDELCEVYEEYSPRHMKFMNRVNQIHQTWWIWWITIRRGQGSPATSPPLCPKWLLVGRRMRPDPPMEDWVHPLLLPGDPVPVTQTEATCCWTSWQISLFWAGATCCILIGRPLEGEATLFGWSGLAWIACLLPHSAILECVGLLESLVSWYTRSRFSIVGHKVGPTSCLLPCLLSCLSKLY